MSTTATLLGLALLTGCRPNNFPDDRKQAAERYVLLLRQQRFEEIETDLSPGVEASGFENELQRMADAFPKGQEPQSMKVVGWDSVHAEDRAGDSITLEYQYPGKWVLANVTMQSLKGRWWITGLSVSERTASVEAVNRFTLLGKGEPQYLVLALGLFSVVCSAYAFVKCLRLPQSRAKWAWLFVTVVGAGGVSVNWTTGELRTQLFYVHVPPVAAATTAYGPWFLFAFLPAGALLFLLLQRGRERMAVAGSAPMSE